MKIKNLVIATFAVMAVPILLSCSERTKSAECSCGEACTHDNGCDKCRKNGADSCSCINPKDTISKSSALATTEVWLDASYSMRGYIDTNEDPKFRAIIAALCNVRGNKGVALFGTKLGIVEKFDSIKVKLDRKNINWSQESNLKSMIETAIKKTEEGGLIFLLTDGIMSGTDEQIKKKPSYNITKRGELTNELKGLLQDKTNIAINISQYYMKFRGIYYCYDNSHSGINVLNERERPLYVIALGSKNDVEEYMNIYFNESEELKTDRTITFGDKNIPYNLSMNLNPKMFTKEKSSENTYKMTKETRMGDYDIVFNVSISILPKFMQENTYIASHGHLVYRGINKNSSEYKNVPSDKYSLSVENGAAKYTVNKTFVSQNSFQFRLDYANPSWIKQSSTDDDKKNYSDRTTFNFEYFVKGLSVLNPTTAINNVSKTTINIK